QPRRCSEWLAAFVSGTGHNSFPQLSVRPRPLLAGQMAVDPKPYSDLWAALGWDLEPSTANSAFWNHGPRWRGRGIGRRPRATASSGRLRSVGAAHRHGLARAARNSSN